MKAVWVRVTYRPRGSESNWWAYGWVFPSDSLSSAKDTLRRVGDWRRWEYHAEEVYSNDIDHPDVVERRREKRRALARCKEGATG